VTLRGCTTERGVSTVVGATLVVAIVVLLSVATIAMVLALGQSELSKSNPQNIGQYSLDIESEGDDTLVVRPQAATDLGDGTEFGLYINREKITTWDGTEAVEIRCLYPGDYVMIRSEGAERSAVIQEHYFDRTTDCAGFNAFPDKFQHARVKLESESAYDEYEINDRYAFGLALDPKGDHTWSSSDIVGTSNNVDFAPIPLSNRWHYVEQYDREIEGLEPPVFLVVMVDNVHWYNRPEQGLHASISGEYNWTDAPPDGFVTGNTPASFNIDDDGNVNVISTQASEPTDDVFLVVKPGCDQTRVKFVKELTGFDNDVYFQGSKIIDDVQTTSYPKEITGPGVECRGDATWD